MTVVQSRVLDPTGEPAANARVTVRLVAAKQGNAPGYAGGATITTVRSLKANRTGDWSLDLIPNVDITPPNTYYTITEEPRFSRESFVSKVIVPVDPGEPVTVAEILAVAPPGPDELTSIQEPLKGDKGDSAYQVAVNNGYAGTEAEFVDSMRGTRWFHGSGPPPQAWADTAPGDYYIDVDSGTIYNLT